MKIRSLAADGFGKGLKRKIIKDRLFHKTDSLDIHDMFRGGGETGLCTSTESGSTRLISRGDACVVFKPKLRNGLYDYCDADAGKNYGYDEFRPDGLRGADIEEVVLPAEYGNLWEEWESQDEDQEKILESIIRAQEDFNFPVRISTPEEDKFFNWVNVK